MNPDPQLSAWNGAKWIGGSDDDLVLYSHYLPVFKINVSLQLDKQSGSTKAGFIYGANDARFMDKNKNMNPIIRQLPNTVPTAHIISAEGLGGDWAHFTSEGYRTLGIRYAATMLPLLGVGTKIIEPEK